MERETDLKEQLRFAEDDLNSLRRKVSDLETENEVMMRQLAKVSSAAESCASKTGGSRPPMTRSYSEGHAQIELELAEHEAEVLKTKLYQSEQENARLVAHIAKLEKESTKLRSASANTTFPGDEFYTVVPDTYYRQKTKVLEQEIEEMKARLGSLNIEVNQNMSAAADNAALKGEVANAIQCSSSNSRTVDMSRKMRLIEEELEVIRERNMLLENENERLIKENRRFSLAANSRSSDLNEDRVITAGKLRRQASGRFSQIDPNAGRFSERISDLEKENALLRNDLARRKRLESIRKEESQLMNENIRTIHVNTASQNELRDRVTELLKENVVLTYELQVERRKNREFENQLDEYREAIRQPNVQAVSADEKEQEMGHTYSQMACFAAELNSGFGNICEDVRRLLANLRNAQLPMVEVAEVEKRFSKESETFLHKLQAFIGYKGHKTDISGQSGNVIHEKLQLANDEWHAAQQKCEAATVRLLQTEDRWNKELEKLKESYENQLRGLKYSLEESEKAKEESRSTAREFEAMLGEKSSRVHELEQKQKQLSSEFNLRYKELQDRTESDRKRIKELELKCQNSENLLEAQRKKLVSEQKTLEAEMTEHKKRLEETQAELSRQKDQAERKQAAWGRQKIELENTIKLLQTELSDFDRKAAKKAADIANAESQRLHAQLEQLKRQAESEKETILQERNDAERKLADYKREAVASAEQYERTKEELSLVKSRVSEQRQQLQDTRKQRDDYRDELGRLQQNWSREKSDLVHKLRQEEKVQQAEQQALRLKYEGRIKVMEDTAKRTQSQLSMARHERDIAKESLQAMEKKRAELKTKHDEEIQELKKQLESLQKENEAVENIKAQLTSKKMELEQLNQTVRNERDLWTIEKKHLESKTKPSAAASGTRNTTEESEKEKLLTEAIEMAAKIRIQMDELKKKHDKEIQNLKDRCKVQRHDWGKEREKLSKRVKDAEDSLRILNIDFQNLLSKEEEWQNEKNCLQAECDTLITYTQDFEIRMLANKYKLDRVAEQLKYLNVKLDNTESTDDTTTEVREAVHIICSQIRSVRDDLSKTRELDKAVKNLQLNSDRYEKMIGGSSVESEISGTPRSIIRSSLNTARNDSRTSKPVFPRTASSESNYSSTTLNRLRSPSPSPRKITTYPEAPPSIILNTQKLVEYDKEGKRHWVRRSMCRSISLDPTPTLKNPLIFEDKKRETPLVPCPPSDRRSHLRSSSTDAKITQQISSKTRDTSPMTDSYNEHSGEKAKGKRQNNFFASLSRGQVRERRQRFEKNRTVSVESSEIGQTIGSLGMQTCLAAMGASSDVEKILHRRPEGDNRAPRSNSASRFLHKIRVRSTSRETKRTIKQQFSSDVSEVESGVEQEEDKSEKSYGCFNASALRRSKLKNASVDTR
ncbi:hypothetical protein M514_06530, partial [Trichuris suis]